MASIDLDLAEIKCPPRNAARPRVLLSRLRDISGFPCICYWGFQVVSDFKGRSCNCTYITTMLSVGT